MLVYTHHESIAHILKLLLTMYKVFITYNFEVTNMLLQYLIVF